MILQCAQMVEPVDTGDLKSPGLSPCGFESRSEHHKIDFSKAFLNIPGACLYFPRAVFSMSLAGGHHARREGRTGHKIHLRFRASPSKIKAPGQTTTGRFLIFSLPFIWETLARGPMDKIRLLKNAPVDVRNNMGGSNTLRYSRVNGLLPPFGAFSLQASSFLNRSPMGARMGLSNFAVARNRAFA